MWSTHPTTERTAIRCLRIGFVFQFHFLLPEFSALENVILPMRKLGHLSIDAMRDKAHGLLEGVGLSDKDHRLAVPAVRWRTADGWRLRDPWPIRRR